MFDVSYKLQRLKNIFKTWEKQKSTLRAKEISEIDLAILTLLSSHHFSILTKEATYSLLLLKSRKDSLLAHQILTWKLKSRVDWIQEGDANTKFFHSFASARRNSKAIGELNNQSGETIEDDTKLKAMSVQHFSELL